MDTYLTIASLRDTRTYAPGAVDPAILERILQAGRVAGSAMNRQQRRFVVLETAQARARVAAGVTRPTNVEGCAVAVAVVLRGASSWGLFDAARSAQNMMLAAAAEGIVSCPNATKDADALGAALGAAQDERPGVVISFGHPVRPRDVAGRSADAWLAAVDRVPLEDLVTRI